MSGRRYNQYTCVGDSFMRYDVPHLDRGSKEFSMGASGTGMVSVILGIGRA